MNKRYLRSAMLIALLATLGASRVALAVDETEMADPTQLNDPLTSAQELTIGSDGSVTVNGDIFNTSTHRDVDFYSFKAKTNDKVTLDIDNVPVDSAGNGMVTILALFGPVQVDSNGKITDPNALSLAPLAQNVPPNTTMDPGSASVNDAYIGGYTITQDGTYVVGVSTYPGIFTDSNNLQWGLILASSPALDIHGTYTLIVSGVSPTDTTPPAPAVLPIGIDIRPGHRNVIVADFPHNRDLERTHGFDWVKGHFRGRGIPVALLSSDDFDAMTVDQSSLKFGANGDEDSLIRCDRRGVDVNRDNKPDLLCHFDFGKAGFEQGDAQGFLTGSTNTGQDFKGEGWLKIISRKRRDDDRGHHHHDRHDHRGDDHHGR